MGIGDRLKNAWNAFKNEGQNLTYQDYAPSSYSKPYYRTWRYSKGSILDTIINRIALDVSMVEFSHIKVDGDPETETKMTSGLQKCLTLEANLDQNHLDFIQEIVFTMMDNGVAAVVPVYASRNPNAYEGYDIAELRVGTIVEWYPRHVKVNIYNDQNGRREDVVYSKSAAAIISNPLYEVVNDSNSTLKRLARKLALLDVIDEGNSSGKLDLILQMPYSLKTDIQRKEADRRVKRLEEHLMNSKYGIAYIDSTEKIIQIGKSIENNMLKEVDYLTKELFNQLGLTNAVFNGTANESEMKNYYDRTINPIAKRIAVEFKRKFLTQTARTQGQDIVYHTDLFTLVPMVQLASALDALRRNVIISTNEARKILGLPPADDPNADKLYNPNMTEDNQMGQPELGENLTDEEREVLGLNDGKTPEEVLKEEGAELGDESEGL